MRNGVLSREQTCRRIGFSPSTLYREVKRGAFPAPVQISARLIGWPESVIAAWLASRPAAAPPPPPLFDDQDAPV